MLKVQLYYSDVKHNYLLINPLCFFALLKHIYIFFLHNQKHKREGILHFIQMCAFPLLECRKEVKQINVAIYSICSRSFSVLLRARICVAGCGSATACMYKSTPRQRCSDSMKEVHGCVMKPIIIGWETGIVCAIDKSLSVMSAVFCQRHVFLLSFFPPESRAPSASAQKASVS